VSGTFFGYTQEQITHLAVTWGAAAFMLYMLFIVGENAWKSKASKRGTLALFFLLAFGMVGFVAKTITEKIMGI